MSLEFSRSQGGTTCTASDNAGTLGCAWSCVVIRGCAWSCVVMRLLDRPLTVTGGSVSVSVSVSRAKGQE